MSYKRLSVEGKTRLETQFCEEDVVNKGTLTDLADSERDRVFTIAKVFITKISIPLVRPIN